MLATQRADCFPVGNRCRDFNRLRDVMVGNCTFASGIAHTLDRTAGAPVLRIWSVIQSPPAFKNLWRESGSRCGGKKKKHSNAIPQRREPLNLLKQEAGCLNGF